MDYETARSLLMREGTVTEANPNSFLARLQQGQPPIPGQVTSILLALKVLVDALQGKTQIERELAYCLYLLAWDSRRQFEAKRRDGLGWPPLLDEDLSRIATAVESIFAGR
ncbi:Dethiobiotin synthetase [Leptolyngbya sp. 'hensonii']|uniref:Dethiobiotin synthetase n=1 Tax=Leptolyngbya sp. 'hensonii' TaxID=1922337 RepID=UPI00094F52C0|nr:Dethiobiotin synthetase [Leptolyngbya sp. 'hensonii']OLP17804.1 Dethiobiotin synthetase [Leptolyngbya sp. 'hensonii']